MMVRIKIARIILQGNSAHLVGTVSKEVNLLEVFVSDMAETEGLVPARREDIKGDLSTNCIGETVVCELLSQNINEFLTQLVYLLQGNHTMSMTFLGNWTLKGITQGSSLHITDIKYVQYSGWSMRNTDHCQ